MKRLKAVSAVMNGTTVRKVAVRDLSVYPDTDAGDAAMLADIQAGRLTLFDRPADNRIIATVAPRVSETRTDSAGRLFVATRPPVQTKTVLPFPPKEGVSFPLVEQTAQGVANFDRTPVTPLLRDKLNIVFGPWYSDPALNRHFDHRINAINAWPNFRPDGNQPYSLLGVDRSKKFFMLDDDQARRAAQTLLDDPANANSPYRVAWDQFANGRAYSTGNPAAFYAIGAQMWRDSRYALDAGGGGVGTFSLDLESTANYQFQRECMGNMYAGYCNGSKGEGYTSVPYTYGQNTFLVSAYDFSLKQAATGFPEYLRDYMDLFPNPTTDATLKAVNDAGGYIAMDGYFQRIHDHDTNIMLRDAQDNLILSNGMPQFNTVPTTGTAYGQTFPLEANEPAHFSSDFRRHFCRLYVNRYWAAGRYPETEADRRPGMENTKHGAYTRVSNEGVLGMVYNDRPLPAWLLKTITMGNLFDSDGQVAWGDDFNVTPGVLGAASTKWAYNAGGVTEAINDATNEYAYYDDYHVGNAKRAWFNLDIVSSNLIEGEYVWQKPVLKVKIRTIAGKQYLEVFAAWPELDRTACDIKLWAIKNGKTSPAFTITIPSGRQYHYSLFAFSTDTEFANLSGDDLRARYVDLLSATRTLIGRYELFPTFDPTTPTPADYDTGLLAPSAPPVSGGGSSALGITTPMAYDPSTHRLKVTVTGASGNPLFTIVGLGANISQPSDGFLLPGNIIGSQAIVRVHTDTQAEIEVQQAIPADSAAPTPTHPQTALPGGQRLKFSLQQVSPNDAANNGFGTVRYQHEPAHDNLPAQYFPAHIPLAKANGMNSVGIYSKRGEYQRGRNQKGNTQQRDNQLQAIVDNNMYYTWRGTIGLGYYSDSNHEFSDLMTKADAMKFPDGIVLPGTTQPTNDTVATNQGSTMPRLALLRAFIDGNQTDTNNPFYWVRQYIIDDVTPHIGNINSGRCEAIGYTGLYRWEDVYPQNLDGNGVYAIGDYSPLTIADFQTRKNTSYTPVFDPGNRGRNSFASAGGKAWYLYSQESYIMLKDWIADVIHSVVSGANVVNDFGQFEDGDAAVGFMLAFVRMSQKAGQIKVNPDFYATPEFVGDVVRSTGKVMEMETDNYLWYDLSVGDMVGKLYRYYQSGFKEVQFGQCVDEPTFTKVLAYAANFTQTHPLGSVASVTTNGSGTYSTSGQLAGNQDTVNLWHLAGGTPLITLSSPLTTIYGRNPAKPYHSLMATEPTNVRLGGYRHSEPDSIPVDVLTLLANLAQPTQAQISQGVADYLAAHPTSGNGSGTGSNQTVQADLMLTVSQTGQTAFSLPAGNQRTILFVNGDRANTTEFSISGTTLTWQGGYPLDARDELRLTDPGTIDTAGSGQSPILLPVTQVGQSVFTLPAGNRRTILFVSGDRASSTSYSIDNTANTLTWSGYYLLDPDDELQLL